MPDNSPYNSFNRDRPQQDPRKTGLFAQSSASDPLLFDDHSETKNPRPEYNPTMSARRSKRLAHSKLKRNILIGISVAIGLVLALIATDTLKLGTGPRPYFSKSSDSFGAQRRSSITIAQNQSNELQKITPQDPLRVYIGGDSLVGSFGNPLATNLGESGVIKATYDSRPSSGLVNANFFNWNSHIRDMISTYNPELIIFMIGTNDASIVKSNPKTYKDDYRKKLETFLTIATNNDRKVYFVLAPAMKDPTLNKNVDKLNDVIFALAHEKNIPTIESGLTLSPDGVFTKTVHSKGKTVNVRTDDGVHITPQGGDLLAKAIALFLDNSLKFTRFSQGEPILPSKVPGCCTTPKSSEGSSKNTSSTQNTKNTHDDTGIKNDLSTDSSAVSSSLPTTSSSTPLNQENDITTTTTQQP